MERTGSFTSRLGRRKSSLTRTAEAAKDIAGDIFAKAQEAARQKRAAAKAHAAKLKGHAEGAGSAQNREETGVLAAKSIERATNWLFLKEADFDWRELQRVSQSTSGASVLLLRNAESWF